MDIYFVLHLVYGVDKLRYFRIDVQVVAQVSYQRQFVGLGFVYKKIVNLDIGAFGRGNNAETATLIVEVDGCDFFIVDLRFISAIHACK